MPWVPKGYRRRFAVVLPYPVDGLPRPLAKAMAVAGVASDEVALLPALRCRMSRPNLEALRACRGFLLHALEVCNPDSILVCGALAARGVFGYGGWDRVSALRGRTFRIPNSERVARVTLDLESYEAGQSHTLQQLAEDLCWTPRDSGPTPGALEGVLAIDTEYAPDGTLLTVGAANTQHAHSWERGEWVTMPTSPVIVGHNIMGDLDYLLKEGICRESWLQGHGVLDTLLLSRLHDENRGAYDLETLACTHLGLAPWKAATQAYSERDATLWPESLRRARCERDAWVTAQLAHRLLPEVGGPITLSHRIAATLHRIELTGAWIDLDKKRELTARYHGEMTRLVDLLQRSASMLGMAEFTPTNRHHVRELLHTKLELPITATTATGLAAVDKSCLTKLSDHPSAGPIAKLLLEYYSLQKLCSTNLEGLDEFLIGARLPVRINPLGARTGRRSSSKPNMQNWNAAMRQLVISRFPGGKIIKADYRSLEPYLLGWVSGDERYLTHFQSGAGYVGIAKDIFGREIAKGTPEYKAIKQVVLGTNYGAGARTIARLLAEKAGVTLGNSPEAHEKEVAKLRKAYLAGFPGISRYMEGRKAEVLRDERVVSATGRIRHLPCPDGDQTPGFAHLLNAAYNAPIQSLASDCTGSAMIDFEAMVLAAAGLTYQQAHLAYLKGVFPQIPLLINEVHDEILVDCPAEWVERGVELLRKAMCGVPSLREQTPQFNLALDVEIQVAANWEGSDGVESDAGEGRAVATVGGPLEGEVNDGEDQGEG
jgi:DNA polymerase I-like protein with 3'-5' exonuclease and polymerase domains